MKNHEYYLKTQKHILFFKKTFVKNFIKKHNRKKIEKHNFFLKIKLNKDSLNKLTILKKISKKNFVFSFINV